MRVHIFLRDIYFSTSPFLLPSNADHAVAGGIAINRSPNS